MSASRTLDRQQAPVMGLRVTDIFAPHASRRIRELTLPALVVGGQRARSDETLRAWTNEVIALVGRFKGCPTPAAEAGISLGGRDALVLTYPNCPAGQNLYHLWTVTVVGGLAYQFVWFNHPGNEAQDRAVLDEMLRSLTFTK